VRRILIAGGGTGGHVFPGLAVARALQRLAEVEVVFVGSPRGLEARIVPAEGHPLELLDVEPMKGGGPGQAIRGALVAAKAMNKARALVRALAPAAAVSVGGYAAGPAALACVSQRVPLAILEPNAVLGLANRLLAPFAKRAYIAWAETARHFAHEKARLLGVPLRAGFEPRPYVPNHPPRVLVLGGSQGAAPLNDRLPGAFARAAETIAAFHVVHQAGRDRPPGAVRDRRVRERYAQAGVANVEVVPFVDDVAAQMAAADLVISRSGAVTVAEIAAIGRAALFIPYPLAADDHQAKNALSLEEIGGAVVVRQEQADEARLGQEIAALLGDATRRSRMADASRLHGRPRAAEEIARDLLGLARIPLRKASTTNGSSSRIRIDYGKGVS
jgi:UDP-N-acetylglucosamine--N-acetylmuramyl-(pentapeptide) pyrophosphoryl-undecaprenol N-acetylglucosamine transferase